MTPSTIVLTDTANCFKMARRALLDGAHGLRDIQALKLWEGTYNSFGEYVEQECQISQSYASKLIKTYEHYIINGGVSHATLEGTDVEKLYLAISLTGTTHEQAVKAETLTRQEIKAELAVKDGVEHECVPISICKTCSKRLA